MKVALSRSQALHAVDWSRPRIPDERRSAAPRCDAWSGVLARWGSGSVLVAALLSVTEPAPSTEQFINILGVTMVVHVFAGSYLGYQVGQYAYQVLETGGGTPHLESRPMLLMTLAVVIGVGVSLYIAIVRNGFLLSRLSGSSEMLRVGFVGVLDGIVGILAWHRLPQRWLNA